MTNAWTLNIDKEWIAWLTFDSPGEKVNLLSSSTMRELEAHIDSLHTNEEIKAIVIQSGKPGSFIAGANIHELAAIQTSNEAREKSRDGHRIFGKLAQLPVPTVAVIDGTCLGGGLEMALACDYRIVADDATTSLGLPEVKLGIIPGWGGTQRLPRLIGLPQAMTMILTGKVHPAKKAYRIGLADVIESPTFLEERTRTFVNDVLSRTGRKKVFKRRWRCQSRLLRLMEMTFLGRKLMYRKAARQVYEHSKNHYPAPYRAIDALRRTHRRCSLEHGLSIEADTFSSLACTPVSRNLVWLFQATQRMKSTSGGKRDGHSRDFQNVGVIGAGIMGGGIAWACSNAKLNTRMKDINWDALAKGMAAAASMNRALVKRRKMTEGGMNLAMHRITPTTDFRGFSCMDVVIEAVVEDLDIKRKVLREIEQHIPATALIATNTSSLSLKDMASALNNPTRFVGLHFFNPVNRMPLVEVVPCEHTSAQAIAEAFEFVKRIGKTPVLVGDCAGFLVNRILVPYLVESAWLLEEGMDAERVDTLLEAFGMPMGPLALVDEVGIDVGYKVAKVLEAAYGVRMHVPTGLGTIANTGSVFGRKSGKGIYLYNNGHKKPNPEIAKLTEPACQDDHVSRRSIRDEDIVDRTVLTMVNEAARCLEEGIVRNPETLDMAMLFGTGFAPFRGGLLRYADERGITNIRNRMYELAAMYGDRFIPAPLIEHMSANNGRFYDLNSEVRKT